MIKSRIFNKEQVQFILDNYKGISEKALWEKINQRFGTNFTFGQVKGFKTRNRLRNGLSAKFEKGNTPFNKGLKQTEYMTDEAIQSTKATRFQKGQPSKNKQPIGYERVGKDGYIEVKVRDNENVHSTKNFEMKHRVIWERHHDVELKENEVIVFLDQDKRNFNIDNLKKVSRGDVARINKNGLFTRNVDINQAAINWSLLQQTMNDMKE